MLGLAIIGLQCFPTEANMRAQGYEKSQQIFFDDTRCCVDGKLNMI